MHCIVQIRQSVSIETKTNQTTHHSSIKSESERDMESTEEVLTLPDLYQIMCDSDESCLPNVFCGTSSLSEILGEATSFGSEFRTQIEYGDKFVPQPSLHLPSMPVKRSRMTYQNVHSSRCQVEGCNLDLELAKDYHRRHRICDSHSKSPKVIVAGMERRFCQQCSKFHGLSEFDDKKRSCRRRLSDHNARRRRVQPDSAQLASAGQPSAKHDQRQQNIILNGIPIPLPKSTREYGNTSPISRQVAGNSLIRPSNPPTTPVPGPTSNPWVHVEDGHSFVTTPNAANSAHSLLSSSSSSYSWWMDEGALNEHGHTN